ncbi:MAG: hypothetical protein AAFR87_12055 [Bacteroidota bacterium]
MIKNKISFCLFPLLLLLISCTPSRESNQTTGAIAEAISEEVQAVALLDTENENLRISAEAQEQHIQYIETWQERFEKRKEAGEIFSFPVKLKGLTNAEAFFFEGKIQKVRWNDPSAGINALRSWMFEEESPKFCKVFDHGNNWYRNNYSFIDIDLGCVPYIDMGELPGSETGRISLDQKVEGLSCEYNSQYTGLKIYHAALLQYAMKEKFFEGKMADNVGLNLKWEEAGEKISGHYHIPGATSEIKLQGYQVEDSLHLFELQDNDTLAIWEGVFEKGGILKGNRKSFEGEKISSFSLQRRRVYTAPNGDKTYQPIFLPKDFEYSYFLIDDSELPYEELEYFTGYHRFTSTSIVLQGDNDYRAIYDYFEYAMTNTLVPDGISRDEGFPDPEFNYYYFINLHQPYYVSEKERNDGYNSDLVHDFNIKNQRMAYLIKHMDRSPRTLETLFSWYENTIYELLPDRLYEKMRLGEYFDELLSSYQLIQSYENYESKLDTVYQQLDSLDQARLTKEKGPYGRIDWEERNDCFRPFFDEEGYAEHIPKLDFWARRQHEGNVRTVASILRRLQKGYAEGKGVDEGH